MNIHDEMMKCKINYLDFILCLKNFESGELNKCVSQNLILS